MSNFETAVIAYIPVFRTTAMKHVITEHQLGSCCTTEAIPQFIVNVTKVREYALN